MIGNQNLAYDLEVAPKREYVPNERDFKVIKSRENKKHNQKAKVKNNKLSLVLTVTALFSMLIVVSLRYNVISEKNLELQRLQIEETNVNSALAVTEVEVEKTIDKDTVESYAKQQLGMQKPEKSQMIYINSEYETKVENVENNNIIQNVIDKLKEIFK